MVFFLNSFSSLRKVRLNNMWRLKMWTIPYQNVLFVLISIFKLLHKKARERKNHIFLNLRDGVKKGINNGHDP